MKKLLGLFLAFMALFTLSSCDLFGGGSGNKEPDKTEQAKPEEKPEKRIFYVEVYDSKGNIYQNFEILEDDYIDEAKLEKPQEPGKVFIGWDYDFTKPVVSNVMIHPKFEEEIYKINIDYGFNGLTKEIEIKYEDSYSLEIPIREGYEFDGFYSDEYTRFDVSGSYNYCHDIKLTARWNQTFAEVIYHLDGGENHKENPTRINKDESFDLKPAERGNDIFDGWYFDPSFYRRVENISFSDNEGFKINLYAKFKSVNKITYELNGGENHYLNPEFVDKKNNYVDLKNPFKENCIFDGWYTDSEYKNYFTGEIHSDITIYAKFIDLNASYTLTFICNDDDNQVITSTVKYNEQFFLPTIKKKGHTLSHFECGVEMLFPSYSEYYRYECDMEFVAVWEKNQIALTVYDGIGNSNIITYLYGDKIDLPDPVREYYDFDGWYLDKYFEEKLTDINDITENASLYPKFIGKEYDITYDYNGGEIAKENPTKYRAGEFVRLNEAVKKGYRFLGYSIEGREGYYYDLSINVEDGANLALKANFEALEFTITYTDGEGYTYVRVKYDDVIPKCPLQKEGYLVDYLVKDGEKFTDTTLKHDTNITLDVVWKTIKYKVTYNLDGGENNPNNPAEVTIEDNIALLNPTKRGYRFLGWKYQDGYIKTICNAKSDYELTAEYEPLKIFIKIRSKDYNYTQSSFLDFASTLDIQSFTKEGYTIEEAYINGVKFTDTVVDLIEDTIIDVVLKPIEYKITYDLDGGVNNANNPTSYNNDTKNKLEFYPAAKDGYEFICWMVDGKPMVDYQFISELKDIHAVAKFGEPRNTIYFVNSFSGRVDALEITKGEEIVYEPEKVSGYKFKGYLLDGKEFTDTIYNFDKSITLDLVYERVMFNITYDLGGIEVKENLNKTTLESFASMKLSAIEAVDSRYVFKGWECQNNWIENIEHIKEDMTIKAVWEFNEFKITYKLVDGAENYNVGLIGYNSESSIELSNAYCKHYTFQGWYLDGKPITRIEGSLQRDIVLEGRFLGDEFKLRYDLLGGTLVNPDTKLEYTIRYGDKLPIIEATRPGYIQAPFDSEYYLWDCDVCVDLCWEEIVYTIEYVFPSVINHRDLVKEYTISDYVSLPTLYLSKYNFLGWDLNGKIINDRIPENTYGNLVLEAKFELSTKTYKVNNDGVIEEFTIPKSDEIYLPSAHKDGYEFLGWYLDGYAVRFPYNVYDGDELVAKYEKINYYTVTITGIQNPPKPIKVREGYYYELPELTDSELEFNGWYSNDRHLTDGVFVNNNLVLEARFIQRGGYLEYKLVGDEAVITGATRIPFVLRIPKKIDFKKVIGIDANAFSSASIDTLYIEDGNLQVDPTAFRYSPRIVNIPNNFNVSSIFMEDALKERTSIYSHIIIRHEVETTTRIFGENVNYVDEVTLDYSWRGKVFEASKVLPKGVNKFEALNYAMTIRFDAFDRTNVSVVKASSLENYLNLNLVWPFSTSLYHLEINGQIVEELDLSKNTLSINPYLFSRSSIKHVHLGQITTIGESAFDNCEELMSLRMSGVTHTICEYAFRGCPLLQDIIYDGTYEQWNRAQKARSGIETLNVVPIEEGVEDIVTKQYSYKIYGGKYITGFKWLDSQAKVVNLVDGFEGKVIATIADGGFSNTESALYFVLPGTINYIGRENRISRKVRAIYFDGKEARYDKIRYALNYFGPVNFECGALSVAYKNDKGFDYFEFSNKTIAIERMNDVMLKDVDLPTIFKGYDVVEIFEEAFISSGIQRLVIPGTLKHVPRELAYGCWDLSSVTFGEGVLTIGKRAFYGTNLSSVVFPESLTGIYTEAFANTKLTSVNIPKNVTEILSSAFMCEGLTSVSMVKATPAFTLIGEPQEFRFQSFDPYMFFNYDINYETLANNMGDVKIYVNDVLYDTLTIDKDFEATERALIGYKWLKEINILKPVAIKTQLFYQINNTVKVNATVDTILNMSYSYMESNPFNTGACLYLDGVMLSDIVIPSGVTEIKPYTFAGFKFRSLELPKGLVKIGVGAFYGYNLDSVTLPEGLDIIDDEAFEYSNIVNLDLPKSVTKVDKSAFACSRRLSTFTYGDNVVFGFDALAATNIRSVVLDKVDISNAFAGTLIDNVHITKNYTAKGYIYARNYTVDPLNPVYTSRDSKGRECNMLANKDTKTVIEMGLAGYLPKEYSASILSNTVFIASDKTLEELKKVQTTYDGELSTYLVPNTDAIDYEVVLNDEFTAVLYNGMYYGYLPRSLGDTIDFSKSSVEDRIVSVNDEYFYHRTMDSIVFPSGIRRINIDLYNINSIKFTHTKPLEVPSEIRNGSDCALEFANLETCLDTNLIISYGDTSINGENSFDFMRVTASMNGILNRVGDLQFKTLAIDKDVNYFNINSADIFYAGTKDEFSSKFSSYFNDNYSFNVDLDTLKKFKDNNYEYYYTDSYIYDLKATNVDVLDLTNKFEGKRINSVQGMNIIYFDDRLDYTGNLYSAGLAAYNGTPEQFKAKYNFDIPYYIYSLINNKTFKKFDDGMTSYYEVDNEILELRCDDEIVDLTELDRIKPIRNIEHIKCKVLIVPNRKIEYSNIWYDKFIYLGTEEEVRKNYPNVTGFLLADHYKKATFNGINYLELGNYLIATGAAKGAELLTTTAPTGYELIGIMSKAFMNNKSIKRIELLTKLDYIGANAFKGMTPDSVIIADSALYEENVLDGIESIRYFEGGSRFICDSFKNSIEVAKIAGDTNLELPNLIKLDGVEYTGDLVAPKLVEFIGNRLVFKYLVRIPNTIRFADIRDDSYSAFDFYETEYLDSLEILKVEAIDRLHLGEAKNVTVISGYISNPSAFPSLRFQAKNKPEKYYHDRMPVGYDLIYLPYIDKIEFKSNEKYEYAVINDIYVAVIRCLDKTAVNVDLVADFKDYSVITIGSRAFKDSMLEGITLPDELTFIGYQAFMNTKLKSINIPKGIVGIAPYAFSNTNIEKLTINVDKVSMMDSFINNSYLKELELIGETYAEDAFLDCDSLERVSFTRDERMFSTDNNIKYVKAPDYAIRKFKFSNATEAFVIRTAYNDYDNNVYNHFKKITFASNSGLNSTFFNGLFMEEVVFEEGTKKIAAGVLANNNYLRRVVIPEGVEAIGEGAFEGCDQIEEIVLPSTIKRIDARAFMDCYKLKKINVPDGAVVGADVFTNTQIELSK